MTHGDSHPLWALALGLAACASQSPAPSTPANKLAPPPPLTTDEMQQIVTGAARLNRHCLDKDAATGRYNGGMAEEKRASACTECLECIEKCPQSIQIPDWLKKVDAELVKKE